MLIDAKKRKFRLVAVDCIREALRQLAATNFDAILLDLSLPDETGLYTVQQINRAASILPIVVLTGLDDEKVASLSLREGVQDYLVKSEMN